MTLASPSPVGAAAALALAAFARDSAADSAIDSVVYDLRAYDPAVPAEHRFVAVSREGIHGFYADDEVASFAVSNRRSWTAPPPPEDEPCLVCGAAPGHDAGCPVAK